MQNTLSVWKDTFLQYDDSFTLEILSTAGWQKVISEGANSGDGWIADADLGLSKAEIGKVIESTPPIPQIKSLFSLDIMEKQTTAYHVFHLRFDARACLAEALIEKFGKQAEFSIYDLMVKERLGSNKGREGSVNEFIEDFTQIPEQPSLETAGLEFEVVRKTHAEAELIVRECEWARYFNDRHPRVGYLMACSTDEAEFSAFNKNLRMQRTQTIMEGAGLCDFRIFAIQK